MQTVALLAAVAAVGGVLRLGEAIPVRPDTAALPALTAAGADTERRAAPDRRPPPEAAADTTTGTGSSTVTEVRPLNRWLYDSERESWFRSPRLSY